MKAQKQGGWWIFTFLLVLLLLVLLLVIILDFLSTYKTKEGFVPRKIKEMYRPMERRVRQTYEGFYSQSVNRISRFLRQLSILG